MNEVIQKISESNIYRYIYIFYVKYFSTLMLKVNKYTRKYYLSYIYTYLGTHKYYVSKKACPCVHSEYTYNIRQDFLDFLY